MDLSIVVPAYNEERGLPETLIRLQNAVEMLSSRSAELVVVDNASADNTAGVARRLGATVVEEPVQGIGRARNRGAARSQGDVLVFVDADVNVPPTLLSTIERELEDQDCVGGGFELWYEAQRPSARVYLAAWRVLGHAIGAVQGGVQFCRRHSFERLGGYNEALWMGEDVEFFWRLRHSARVNQKRVAVLRDPKVIASARRFDQWPLYRTLLYTNPLVASLLAKRRKTWERWYRDPPR
jgi:glycosyltransferase involved in cell wall biosynthesis